MQQTFHVARAHWRILWRSRFLRISSIGLITLALAMAPQGGTDMLTMLSAMLASLLLIHLVRQQRREQATSEQVWSTGLETSQDTLGMFLAYSGGAVALLLLSWLCFLPFGFEGQAAGRTLSDGTLVMVSTLAPFQMQLKVLLSTQCGLSLLLLLRRRRFLSMALAIGYWLYAGLLAFMLPNDLEYIVSHAGYEHSPLRYLVYLAPLTTSIYYSFSAWPWLLPCVGLVLILLAAAVLRQRRIDGHILISRRSQWLALLALGVGMVVVGEIVYMQFIYSFNPLFRAL